MIGGVVGPSLIGNVAGAVSGPVQARCSFGNAAQAGAGLIGYTADGKPVYGGAALPPGMGQYGPTSPYGSPLDVLGPAGMGQRLDTLKTAQTQRDVLRTLLPEIEAAAEARSKKEFERQNGCRRVFALTLILVQQCKKLHKRLDSALDLTPSQQAGRCSDQPIPIFVI